MWERILWSVFITAIFCGSFKVVWNREHKTPQGAPESQNNQMLYPLVFPIILLIALLSGIVFSGWKRGVLRFFCQSADVFLFLSVYFLLLLLLLPFLRRHISARACAALWLVPVFLFYQLSFANSSSVLPFYVVNIPEKALRPGVYIWLAGFAAVLFYQIISHFWFRNYFLKHSQEITREEVLRVWKEEMARVHYTKSVRLLSCSVIRTPLSMGVFSGSRVTLLPERQYSEKELHFIFCHELYHLKRYDVETKIFLGFCKAFCWFNPLVWIAVKKASEDLELSCDEIVLTGAKKADRQAYAELLLRTAGSSGGYTTCLSAAANSLKYRMRAVMRPGKRYVGVLALTLFMLASCFLHGSILLGGERETAARTMREFGVEARDISFISRQFTSSRTGARKEKEGCEEKLFDYLSGIETERLYTERKFNQDNQGGLYLWSDKKEISIFINDMILQIDDLANGVTETYKVDSKIHWKYIEHFFV